ncbi:MAG: hypothetical protein COB67_04390 [SAR324 cluster bacterium]|uniref:Uncharacterized protein n=1 Tax=SAR324 cluster bacterium TaxID=2024889 RepID=A0A2A4T840_9DELT|nr:MAG: hypothetical protein COB67_04390 [SAR324 cluster bacterium]
MVNFRLFILLLSLCFITVPLQAQEKQELFSQAQATFNQGVSQQDAQKRRTMLKAAGQFLSLVQDQGIDNGYLYYNIGNAYYEAGEKGQAILYYRKAERLIPGYNDLQYNLTRVREDLHLPQTGQTWWSSLVKGMFFWHFMLDYSTRSIAFMLTFTLFWLLLIVSIFYRNIFLIVGQSLTLLAVLSLGTSYFWSGYQLHRVQSGVITTQEAQSYKGPGFSYEEFFEQPLPGGTEFRLLDQQGSWWKVKLKSGEELWLQEQSSSVI